MKTISINNRRYIGSKFRMINFISETIKKEKIEYSSFLDLFGGTGIVGDFFNDQKTKVYVNDLLKSNYISYLAWFGNEKIDKNKIREYIEKYNSLTALEDNYFSLNFSNTYFSEENCKKIGSSLSFSEIIKQIIYWKEKNKGKNDINVLELFNLNLEKIKYIREKLNEIKKNAKDNRLDGNDSIMVKFLNQQEETYTIQKMEIDGLINNLEYIETITYGDKWSVVQLKETKK